MNSAHWKRACPIKREYLGNLIRKLLALLPIEKLCAINVNRHSHLMMNLPSMKFCAKLPSPLSCLYIHLHVTYVRNLLANSWSKYNIKISNKSGKCGKSIINCLFLYSYYISPLTCYAVKLLLRLCSVFG